MNRRLAAGDTPAKGTRIELCRSNGFGRPTLVEWFVSDGTFVVPRTTNRYFYRCIP